MEGVLQKQTKTSKHLSLEVYLCYFHSENNFSKYS